MKKNYPKPSVSTRNALPKLQKDKNGSNVLMCPFCTPSHPISPFANSTCGTTVEVRAIQTVYKSRYNKNMVCAKCGQTGGEMVLWQNAFIHAYDCTPGVFTMATPPQSSKIAKLVYNLPDGRIKDAIQKYTGRAMTVDEVKPNGERTGVVLGHFFMRKPNDVSKDGQRLVGR